MQISCESCVRAVAARGLLRCVLRELVRLNHGGHYRARLCHDVRRSLTFPDRCRLLHCMLSTLHVWQGNAVHSCSRRRTTHRSAGEHLTHTRAS